MLFSLCSIYMYLYEVLLWILWILQVFIWSSWQLTYSVSSECTDTVCINRFTACSSSLETLDQWVSQLNDAEIIFAVEYTFFLQYWTDNSIKECLNRFPFREKDIAWKFFNTFLYFWTYRGTWAFLMDLLMYYPFSWR